MNPKKPKIEYFGIQKNWRKLRSHVESDEAQDILVRDFNMFTFGRWKIKFKKGMLPTDFELCDWQDHYKGPRPEYCIFISSSKKSRFNHNKCETLTFMFVEMISNGVMPDTTRDYVRGVSRYYVRNSGITDNQFSSIKKIFQQTVKDQNWLEKYETQLKQIETKGKLREQLHFSKAH